MVEPNYGGGGNRTRVSFRSIGSVLLIFPHVLRDAAIDMAGPHAGRG